MPREVLTGRYYMSARLADRVRNGNFDGTVNPAGMFRTLTPRLREVLQLIAEGKAAKEIAWMLSISPKTVESHKSCMMDELGVRTTAELVCYAVQYGIVHA
jgi:DNA-binding NarL/FixJ family response regulator